MREIKARKTNEERLPANLLGSAPPLEAMLWFLWATKIKSRRNQKLNSGIVGHLTSPLVYATPKRKIYIELPEDEASKDGQSCGQKLNENEGLWRPNLCELWCFAAAAAAAAVVAAAVAAAAAAAALLLLLLLLLLLVHGWPAGRYGQPVGRPLQVPAGRPADQGAGRGRNRYYYYYHHYYYHD